MELRRGYSFEEKPLLRNKFEDNLQGNCLVAFLKFKLQLHVNLLAAVNSIFAIIEVGNGDAE